MTANKKNTEEGKVEESKTTNKKNGFAVKLLFAFLFAVLVIGASFLLWQNYQLKAVASDVGGSGSEVEMTDEQIQNLLAKVGGLIVLPVNEEPTIATIIDASKLSQEQAFYKDVQNGDKVLIYMQAQKAIIYRETENRLINVGPVYTNTAAPTDNSENPTNLDDTEANAIEQSQESLKIEVRNGSKTAGVAGKLRDKLETNELFEVIGIADANNKTFTKTIVVDLSAGNKVAQIQALQAELEAELVHVIPDGENETEAEVLVIIGG